MLDNLGVKSGVPFATVGFAEPLCPDAHTKPEGLYDLVVLYAPTPSDLDAIRPARVHVAPRGGLWVVYPRGSKTVPENLVRTVAGRDDWTDIKTCRFDDERTALKFVRRLR